MPSGKHNGHKQKYETPRLSSANRVFHQNHYAEDGYLSFKVFLFMSQLPCVYCGAVSSCRFNRYIQDNRSYPVKSEVMEAGWFEYNGLDRKLQSMPHSVGNVVPCCKTCNWLKGTMNAWEFLEHIQRIASYQESNCTGQQPSELLYPTMNCPICDRRMEQPMEKKGRYHCIDCRYGVSFSGQSIEQEDRIIGNLRLCNRCESDYTLADLFYCENDVAPIKLPRLDLKNITGDKLKLYLTFS